MRLSFVDILIGFHFLLCFCLAHLYSGESDMPGSCVGLLVIVFKLGLYWAL